MSVSRSGFYKWKNRKPSSVEKTREEVVKMVSDVNSDHPTHGYRWAAAYIRLNLGHSISDNYAYKCFRYLGIRAKTKHQIHRRPRKERDKYPNLIFSTWDMVDRPKQVIVSDMTALKFWLFYFEVTFYFDVFTKEILSWKLAERRGCRGQYIEGLIDVKELLKGCTEPAIVHTDQGSVYASVAYNELIKDTCIVRSMSRAGKPTDNPVNEALNGWIKEELLLDFKMDHCRNKKEVKALLEQYVKFYNEQRPCCAIGYDTPDNYRKRFYKGELEQKNTFENRVLTPEPKFVQRRRKNAHMQEAT